MGEEISALEDEKRSSIPKRVGGHLCLDFTNTVDPRHGKNPHDYLKNYPDLIAWSRSIDIIKESEIQPLLKEAALHSAIATIVFQRTLMLREALYQIFSTVIKGQKPDKGMLEILNVILAEGMAQAQICAVDSGFTWTWDEPSHALERVLWPIARSAAELLISEDIKYLKECPGDDGCGWLFVDTSRNHRRRWCDMEGCGNRAKAQRHYERTGRQKTVSNAKDK